jgi:hypothetical protein
MNATTRRSALLGSALASLIGAPVVAKAVESSLSNPDAELLDLCAEFHRLHATVLTGADGAWEVAQDQRWGVSHALELIPAQTAAGRVAKASVALALIRENQNLECMDGDVSMAFSALVDIAGGSAA